jgi:hypothetical protein
MAGVLVILILFVALLLLAGGIVEGTRALRRWSDRRFARARLRQVMAQQTVSR